MQVNMLAVSQTVMPTDNDNGDVDIVSSEVICCIGCCCGWRMFTLSALHIKIILCPNYAILRVVLLLMYATACFYIIYLIEADVLVGHQLHFDRHNIEPLVQGDRPYM